MVTTLRFHRRNLPHWMVADHPYFVTLRLHGTIPRHVLEQLIRERNELLAMEANEEKWTALMRRQSLRIEDILDACDGQAQWLGEAAVAGMFLDSLQWLESARGWRIYAAAVMPNHVHMVLRNKDGRNGALLEDLGHLKRFTARMGNRILTRRGTFWAREDFDHWCRTPDKVLGAVAYSLGNPVKAGLVRTWAEWPWHRVDPEFAAAMKEGPVPPRA